MRNERTYLHVELTRRIIGCAIEVHRVLGPGLLECFYQRAVSMELRDAGLHHVPEPRFPVAYKGHPIGEHRSDFDVEETVLVETKAVEAIAPVHRAIVISTLKASRRPIALLINFHVALLREGIERLALKEALP